MVIHAPQIDSWTDHRSVSARVALEVTPRGTVRAIESNGENVTIARGEGGDLYAAKDGEVYRRTEGGWEQHNGSGWSKSSQAAPAAASTTSTQGRVGELERDRLARQRGIDQYQGYRQQAAQGVRTPAVRRRR